MVHPQFTCTVRLDLKTCWRAWGHWMLNKEYNVTTDDESDSTDDESDESNGYPPGWGWLRPGEEDASFADNVSPVAGPPYKIIKLCHRQYAMQEIQTKCSQMRLMRPATRSAPAVGESRLGVICAQSILTALDMYNQCWRKRTLGSDVQAVSFIIVCGIQLFLGLEHYA